MTKRAIAVSAGIGLLFCGTAFGRDSGHSVCSGVTSFQGGGDDSRIGISIVLDDFRAPGHGGTDREWLLSWVYAGKLFQGSVLESGDSPVMPSMHGHVVIKNGKHRIYVGAFKVGRANAGKPNEQSVLILDGKVTDDPASDKLYPVKATLPCVDIST